MLHTAYILGQTRNKYGDYIATSETAVKCHFRVNDELQHNNQNDQIESDAQAWFEPDSGVQKGTIVKFEGTHYKVEQYIEARKLRNPNIQFIKTRMMKYGPIS